MQRIEVAWWLSLQKFITLIKISSKKKTIEYIRVCYLVLFLGLRVSQTAGEKVPLCNRACMQVCINARSCAQLNISEDMIYLSFGQTRHEARLRVITVTQGTRSPPVQPNSLSWFPSAIITVKRTPDVQTIGVSSYFDICWAKTQLRWCHQSLCTFQVSWRKLRDMITLSYTGSLRNMWSIVIKI